MKLPYVLAKRFVAGEDFSQAEPKIKSYNRQGINITLDLLGEEVNSREEATEAADNYIKLLKNIDGSDLKSTISIKLTMLGLSIDKQFCKDNIFRLLEAARHYDQFVRIDMEGSDYTQATIDIFKKAYKQFGKHVGIVIQAYLHRSKDDIAELAKIGADIRLCKGAYAEPERIALQKMPAIREAYKDYSRILLQKTQYPRIATHDDELLEWVKTYTNEKKIGKARFEFQMLYGMREQTLMDLSQEGYNTRIYVPFGSKWLPYFTRRLKERKENVWFVLSTLFKK